jgi:hypothetical protein
MKIASKMMIGSGIPISQSNNPRPNPILLNCCQIDNAEEFKVVPLANSERQAIGEIVRKKRSSPSFPLRSVALYYGPIVLLDFC